MPTDDPLQLLRRLHTELVRRRPTIAKAADYYDGAHNLAFASQKFREAFGGLFGEFADNWCAVVADAVEERLKLQGFRVSPTAPALDKDAKRLWETNELDLQASTAHLDGLVCGAFFVTVWPDGKGSAEITTESAELSIVAAHPKMPRRRTAGLRTYVDDDGFEHAELFTPDRVYLMRSKAKRTGHGIDPLRTQWVIDDRHDSFGDLDTSGSMVNPFGTVPMVEFRNRPRLTPSRRAGWAAHSEISRIMPLQDAANKLLSDMLIASEFAAFPQRHLTGYTPEDVVDEAGKPTGAVKDPNFKSGPGRLWWLEEENAKFGQFEAADLSNAVKSISLVVAHIAAISATPPHYLNPGADRLSGESIKSAESGLVAKVRRRMVTWGAGWEEVMRLAGAVISNAELANATSMETVWGDPETRTESEHVDAVAKKKDLDVPAPQLWEELGYSPEQVQRFPAMRAQMQLEGMAANAAERARLATVEARQLAERSIAATGGTPAAPVS